MIHVTHVTFVTPPEIFQFTETNLYKMKSKPFLMHRYSTDATSRHRNIPAEFQSEMWIFSIRVSQYTDSQQQRSEQW